jgi:hypothetical protein
MWYSPLSPSYMRISVHLLFQKPLTMYFLRKAQELFRNRVPKELSPSYWDAEGQSATDSSPWFDAIISGIEHPLGWSLFLQDSAMILRDVDQDDCCIPLETCSLQCGSSWGYYRALKTQMWQWPTVYLRGKSDNQVVISTRWMTSGSHSG